MCLVQCLAFSQEPLVESASGYTFRYHNTEHHNGLEWFRWRMWSCWNDCK